jgi:DNA-binding transcriptional MerR regulator
MGYAMRVIPEKLFFKIGEVCEIVGVQPHVLRYWETEFPMLAPQKNRSGQRTYRQRDVEIALRIKELLYDELYTIAGAKKKLQAELRESNKLKVFTAPEPSEKVEVDAFQESVANSLKEATHNSDFSNESNLSYLAFDSDKVEIEDTDVNAGLYLDHRRREALRKIAAELLELREMLRQNPLY